MTKPIYSDDPDALGKLADRIQELTTLQDHMKRVNRQIRSCKKKGMEDVEIMHRLVDLFAYSPHRAAKLLMGDSLGRIGYADYELTNNNGNIRRLKARLETLGASA